jgi:hypothetical protein
VYDTRVLIAADRGERRIWAEHRVRREAGNIVLVPFWGSPRTTDVVDAAVVALALERGADEQTGDTADIRRLIGSARAKLAIRTV